MADQSNHKQKFINKCIEQNDSQQKKLNVLQRSDYEKLLSEVKSAWSANPKSNKNRRRMARYEIIEDSGRERLIKTGTANGPKYVLTLDEMFDILVATHTSTGHGRRQKMIAMASGYENISRSLIEIFLNNCMLCHEKKSLTKKTIVSLPMVMHHYIEKMQMELIDMQSKPDGEFKWILVCQDHFTKWISLRPLRHKSGLEVANSLIDVFAETGTPERLQSDNGREF